MDRELEALEALEARALLGQRRMRARFLWLQHDLRPILLKGALWIVAWLIGLALGIGHIDPFAGLCGMPSGFVEKGREEPPNPSSWPSFVET